MSLRLQSNQYQEIVWPLSREVSSRVYFYQVTTVLTGEFLRVFDISSSFHNLSDQDHSQGKQSPKTNDHAIPSALEEELIRLQTKMAEASEEQNQTTYL